jgi:hypothetical protein
MSQLSELVAMESQISALRESIQQSYSGIEFADYEIKDFVSAMVANIQEPECLQALVRLEQIATENYISLSDIAVGVALPQTESTVICARYVDSYDTVCYYELDICTTNDNVVDGIYSVYK